ncbi:MAG: DUF4197 domain-containing protein [Bacteroidota bacterium]
MKNQLRSTVIFAILGICSSCEILNQVASLPSSGSLPLTESEIISGLKEALNVGLDNSVDKASLAGGYLKNEAIKILLPKDVLDLKEKIEGNSIASAAYNTYVNRFNGGSDLFNELLKSMNRGAENAAKKAGPIFLGAVKTMSFNDAKGILNGGDKAATQYFERTTSSQLFSAFNPEMKSALQNTGASKVYEKTYDFLNYDPAGLGITTVGKILDVSIAPSLDQYATTKAIDGLFYLVGEEETKIRANPYDYGKRILERVFGKN